MTSLDPKRHSTFVIMGAAGRVGGTAARRLRRLSLPVRALIHSDTAARDLHAIGCDVVVVDIRNPERLAAAIGNGEHVLAICPMRPQEDDAMNYHGQTINSLAHALRHARPKHVVAISDYGAHVASDTGVTTLFRELERWLSELDSALTFLRSAEHMENWSRVLPQTVKQGVFPVFYQPREKQLPIVSAFDVGAIAAELLMQPAPQPGKPKIVHVEGPKRYTVGELVRTVQELSRRSIQPFVVPPEDHLAALTSAGLNKSYAGLLARLYLAHNAGLIDVEPGIGEIRRGIATVEEVFGAILRRNQERRRFAYVP